MNILFKKQKLYLVIFLIFSVLVSLVLQGKIEEFHIFGFLILFGCFYLSYLFYSFNHQSPYYIKSLLIVTLLFKIAGVFIVAEILQQYIGIPFLSYKDDYTYQQVSSEIMKVWESRGFGFYTDVSFSTGFYSGFPNFSALAMYLFGDSYVVPRIMNCFFSTGTVWFFYKTIKDETSEKITKQVTTLFAFSLAFIFYSSLQLKDTILVFLLSALIFYFSEFLRSGLKLKLLLGVTFFSILLVFFRAATLLPLLMSLLLTLFLTKEKIIGLKTAYFLYLFLLVLSIPGIF